jgi:hypothetical protein
MMMYGTLNQTEINVYFKLHLLFSNIASMCTELYAVLTMCFASLLWQIAIGVTTQAPNRKPNNFPTQRDGNVVQIYE